LRVLITGASGFAGGYLAQACARKGDEVVGVSRRGAVPRDGGEGRAVDLLDGPAVRAVVREVKPDVIFHLAALSSVGRSWEEPAQTVQENVATAVNVLEALRLDAPDAAAVWVSSCEVYGPPEQLPVSEDAPVNPANPYAVSKTTGDQLAGVYRDAHGLRIVRARPFNHTGPGQLPIFVVSSLARQAAQARLARVESVQIVTGNPDTRRDFTDVRDIVRAYRLLADLAGGDERSAGGSQEHSPGAGPSGDRSRPEPGIYNVSSGQSVSTAEQVQLLAELIAPVRIEHTIDPTRVRAHEVMDLRGSHARLTEATGWQPEIPFRQTISDAIDWWEQQLKSSPSAMPH
jgi:GDP-4-dehydro-6-deoxy-D-mannose reductase